MALHDNRRRPGTVRSWRRTGREAGILFARIEWQRSLPSAAQGLGNGRRTAAAVAVREQRPVGQAQGALQVRRGTAHAQHLAATHDARHGRRAQDSSPISAASAPGSAKRCEMLAVTPMASSSMAQTKPPCTAPVGLANSGPRRERDLRPAALDREVDQLEAEMPCALGGCCAGSRSSARICSSVNAIAAAIPRAAPCRRACRRDHRRSPSRGQRQRPRARTMSGPCTSLGISTFARAPDSPIVGRLARVAPCFLHHFRNAAP